MANRNRSGYFRYQDRNMGGRPPRYFYSVPCLVCGAAVDQPCCEKSTYDRTKKVKWTNPHKSRIVRVRRIDELKE